MNEKTIDRRELLKLGATTGVLVMAGNFMPEFSWADTKSVHLADCLTMSPEKMANSSKLVQKSWQYLKKTIETIADTKLRGMLTTLLENPVPSFLAISNEEKKKAIYEELSNKKLLDNVAPADFLPPLAADRGKSPQPFHSAPGSGYQSHHAYPGGVVTHTAFNLQLSLAILQHYKDTYGYVLDRNVVIASQILHDIHKGWVFQWQEDGACRTELKLAGTGEHHIYSLAESMHRGFAGEICVAQACAHNHPGTPKDEAETVGWLQAAAILAGVDPVAKGYLAKDGKSLPLPRRMENFVCHLGDHDWVLTVPAVQWLLPELEDIARNTYKMSDADLKGKKFNSFRNYVFSQATAMHLYHHYTRTGKKGLSEKVTGLVVPA